MRRKTRVIKIGDVRIGGEHPIVVQSMTKIRTAMIMMVIKTDIDYPPLAIRSLASSLALWSHCNTSFTVLTTWA
jgi:hypothetical protein